MNYKEAWSSLKYDLNNDLNRYKQYQEKDEFPEEYLEAVISSTEDILEGMQEYEKEIKIGG